MDDLPRRLALRDIARQFLGVRTFTLTGNPQKDYHGLSVLNIETALRKAYDAGAARTPERPYRAKDQNTQPRGRADVFASFQQSMRDAIPNPPEVAHQGQYAGRFDFWDDPVADRPYARDTLTDEQAASEWQALRIAGFTPAQRIAK